MIAILNRERLKTHDLYKDTYTSVHYFTSILIRYHKAKVIRETEKCYIYVQVTCTLTGKLMMTCMQIGAFRKDWSHGLRPNFLFFMYLFIVRFFKKKWESYFRLFRIFLCFLFGQASDFWRALIEINITLTTITKNSSILTLRQFIFFVM